MNSNSKTKKHLHLTLDDRIEIQECLSHGMTFKATGQRIGKDQTTVSKEVKKRIEIRPTSVKRTDKYGNPITSICPKLLKPPFVCNPCPKAHSPCSFDRHLYCAKPAQKEYESVLSSCREGLHINENDFLEIDKTIYDGIKKGQRLYHILKTYNLPLSQQSFYRWVSKGKLSISAIDLPRTVKFKHRKPKLKEYIPQGLKIGRSYDDFTAYIKDNDVSHWVEMDTVIGRIGGKVILTFHFTVASFMFGLLLENKTAPETSAKICQLKQRLLQHDKIFGDIFALLLTDNGGEFADVPSIECDSKGNHETRLFFCDPMCPHQKARIEKNHTLFRDIIPKGKSFDSLTQGNIDIIFSHINSQKRQSLNGKTPYELFSFFFSKELAALFGISFIPPQQVVQSPKLIQTLGVQI